MDCQLFERQMQRGIDRCLAPEERADMLKHAAACPDCAALLQDMTALDGLLQAQLSSVEPPEDFLSSVMSALPAPYRKPVLRVLFPRGAWQRWAGAAAAAALLVTFGFWGFMPSTQEQGVFNTPLHPGIAAILNERRIIIPQSPEEQNQQPDVRVAVTDPLGMEKLLPPDREIDDPAGVVAEEGQPSQTTDPNQQLDTPVEEPEPFSAAVDLPKPAAYSSQPEGVLSQILLAAYDDCDAQLPSLNAEGLVEFYIRYKGVSHLWTQSLSAEEAPVYVGQVKSLPTVALITNSADGSTAAGYTLVSAVSPDGRTLAVNRGGDQPGLWLCENVESADIAAFVQEQGQVIPDAVGGGKVLCWSPDGNKLLYTNAEGKLFVYYLAEQLPLELYAGTVTCASWAEDSMTVVFAGKESKEHRSAIYTILLP